LFYPGLFAHVDYLKRFLLARTLAPKL
jgi:hypothetical protein